MLKFSANLTMLFNEVDFLARFKRASEAGFKGVEYLFPYQWDKEQLLEQLETYSLKQVLHNLPAGNWQAGERGIACLSGRESEFQEGVGLAIEYAKKLRCPCLNCLIGITPDKTPLEKVYKTLVDNLLFAADALEKVKIRLLIEPLNSQDMPGFYLIKTRDAIKLIEEIGHPNIWLQYDVYHMQIMEGNLIRSIQDNLPRIAHIQIADNPGRHEPGTGEINYPNVFRFIDSTNYDAWIGCEYRPAGKTEDGLVWAKDYLRQGGKP